MNIVHLPENILLSILQLCSAQDLVVLSLSCKLFHRIVKDPFLWRHLCFRDFNLCRELCAGSSYEGLYKNVLHKYGYMLGVYQSQIGPYGGLLEVRFQDGIIEGVVWSPSVDIMKPLKKSVLFTVSGNEVPAKCLCIPYLFPHKCSLHIDKRKGILTQYCSDGEGHIRSVFELEEEFQSDRFRLKIVFLNEVLTAGLVHKPLILPESDDVPSALRRKDGSFPRQIITPGLFKGQYSLHGTELLLFRYKDEHEIHGHKVTGDPNVYAGKISVKMLLKFPVDPIEEDKNSITNMKSIEPKSSKAPLDQIPEQPFSIPADCSLDDNATSFPAKCVARYHGFGQVAYDGFQKPSFIPAQVVIFNNDLLGVIWIELQCFSLFSRVQQSFTRNVLKSVESCL